MIIYVLTARTGELDPEEVYTDIQIAGPRSERLYAALHAIEVFEDGAPSRHLWYGMRKVDARGARWEWWGPNKLPLDHAPITWIA